MDHAQIFLRDIYAYFFPRFTERGAGNSFSLLHVPCWKSVVAVLPTCLKSPHQEDFSLTNKHCVCGGVRSESFFSTHARLASFIAMSGPRSTTSATISEQRLNTFFSSSISLALNLPRIKSFTS